MKAVVWLVFGSCMLAAAPAVAQAPAAAQGGQSIPLHEGLRRSYNTLKMNLTETAQKLPEADYTYRPSPDIRTFGGQLAHVANSQFNACSAAKGEPNPHQGTNLEKTKTTRADIVQALADSFAFCDPVFQNLTDQSALELVQQGQNKTARGQVLVGLLSHGNLEYGILTVYLRTKSIVPPSTERGMRGRGAAAPAAAPAAPARGQ
jgi:DinB superfamily